MLGHGRHFQLEVAQAAAATHRGCCEWGTAGRRRRAAPSAPSAPASSRTGRHGSGGSSRSEQANRWQVRKQYAVSGWGCSGSIQREQGMTHIERGGGQSIHCIAGRAGGWAVGWHGQMHIPGSVSTIMREPADGMRPTVNGDATEDVCSPPVGRRVARLELLLQLAVLVRHVHPKEAAMLLRHGAVGRERGCRRRRRCREAGAQLPAIRRHASANVGRQCYRRRGVAAAAVAAVAVATAAAAAAEPRLITIPACHESGTAPQMSSELCHDVPRLEGRAKITEKESRASLAH